MRKLVLFALLPVAVLTSCGLEIAGEIQVSEGCAISATIESAESRVQLSQGVKTLWEGTEVISVFGAAGGHYRYATEDSGATATFRACTGVTVEESILTGDSYVLYPYRGDNAKQGNNDYVTSIDAQQTGASGDYGSQKPLLVGRVSTEGKVAFKHASTVVRVNIVSENITAVTFMTNGGEPVAGAVTVDYDGTSVSVTANGTDTEVTMLPPADAAAFAPGEYNFIIAPGTFSNGFTLSWEPAADGFTSSRSYTKPFTALPGHILDCGKVEFVKEAETYRAPGFLPADVIGHFYSWGTDSFIDVLWFNIIPQAKQHFIYPHMLVSYLASEWYKKNNLEYIIMGEVPIDIPCDNVGRGFSADYKYHADSGYSCIVAMTPTANIKSCGGSWEHLEPYVNGHSDKLFMVSCAADKGPAGDNVEDLQNSERYDALKRLLANDNLIISVASMNVATISKRLSERVEYEEGGSYGSASVFSDKNNKICVVGYDPGNNNVFGQDEESLRPIGFDKGNIVMPMMPLVEKDFELTGSTSSFPTATLSSTLGNFLSILMKTHPAVTLEGANTILQENYLREEKFKYVDDADGNIKEGGEWYFFDTDKFFEYEVLQKDAVDTAVKEIAGRAGNDAGNGNGAGSGDDAVALPSGGGLCYMGPGVQFEVGDSRLDMTEENRAVFEAAWKTDPASLKWFFSPARAAEYGATGSTGLTVRVLDTQARLIPDLSRTVTVTL